MVTEISQTSLQEIDLRCYGTDDLYLAAISMSPCEPDAFAHTEPDARLHPGFNESKDALAFSKRRRRKKKEKNQPVASDAFSPERRPPLHPRKRFRHCSPVRPTNPSKASTSRLPAGVRKPALGTKSTKGAIYKVEEVLEHERPNEIPAVQSSELHICGICSLAFRSLGGLKRHQGKRHSEGVQCTICGTLWLDKEKMLEHRSWHVRESKPVAIRGRGKVRLWLAADGVGRKRPR